MSYYEQNIPPTREQRLTIGDSFSGCGKELLDCAQSGCMLQKNRKFWQAGACQMQLSLMMAATVENSVIIMHGPVGCGSTLHSLGPAANKGKAKRGKKPQVLVWLTTNLQESDVIGGGEKKLRETVEYADKTFRPEIIFVVSTCTPSIIGDDVEEVVRQTHKGVAAHLVSIHCPGFRTRVVATAYDSFYHGLLKHLPLEPLPGQDFISLKENEPGYELAIQNFAYRKNRTVNLFNATSIGPADEEELVRLLKALNLNVQVYTEYSSLAEYRKMSQAALNISMCNVHDDYLLAYLKDKYGLPYVIQGMPIGTKAVRKWLLAVAEHFGLEEKANRLADQEEKQVNEALQPFLPALKGKRVLISGGVVRVAEEAKVLKDLGLEVIGVRAYHYDNGAEPIYGSLADELPEVHVSVSNQLFELANQIARYQPDLVIAHSGTQGWVAKMGVPAIQLFDVDRAYFGYRGLFSLVKRIAFAFENTSLPRRLAQHVNLPYKKEWYEKDPFSYLKG